MFRLPNVYKRPNRKIIQNQFKELISIKRFHINLLSHNIVLNEKHSNTTVNLDCVVETT